MKREFCQEHNDGASGVLKEILRRIERSFWDFERRRMVFIQEEVEEGNSGGEVSISNVIWSLWSALHWNKSKRHVLITGINHFFSSQANLPSSQGSISPPLGELAEVNQVGSKEALEWNILCRGLYFFFPSNSLPKKYFAPQVDELTSDEEFVEAEEEHQPQVHSSPPTP